MADEEPPIDEDEDLEIFSILLSIKKLLGLEVDYVYYDQDLIIYINSAFSTLHQLGFDSFSIATQEAEWSDFLGDRTDLELAKTYVYLKVRQLFDPPPTGYLVEALSKLITEYEWRLKAQMEVVEV